MSESQSVCETADHVIRGARPVGVEIPPDARPTEARFVPEPPQRLEETGLAASVIEQLIIKTLYFHGEIIGRDLADLLGLHFSVIAPTVEMFRRRRIFEVKGSLGFGDVSTVFALTDAGRTRAREYLEENQYVGAAPVPIADYTAAVRRQRYAPGWLTQDKLLAAYSGVILPPEILSQLGPALNSGKSFLIYGQPGNGKTYLAQSVSKLEGPPIFLPYAIEASGQIVQLFDPIYHERVDEPGDWQASGYDGRWARCKRPFIMTGGEMLLNMLDLGYNSTSKVYDAPLQMRANNGVYLIDDFGRQKATPAEVLNRWIVPMERGVDFLTFATGMKIEVPFDAFLIFSTNLNPSSLGDEAFLRRIEYKMWMKNPSREEFAAIFRQVCQSRNLSCADDLIFRFIEEQYLPRQKPFRRCHPRDVLSHAVDIIQFERRPARLTPELLEQAFNSCFIETSDAELV
jgi:predicted ATPase with chaperone activity